MDVCTKCFFEGVREGECPHQGVDLCECGAMTRALGHCDCEPTINGVEVYSGPERTEEWVEDKTFPRMFQGTSPQPENVLQEADRITSGQRRDDYGHPLDDFAKVQGMAKALWGRGPETEEEHAIYMIFVKLAREVHAHKRDNLVDIAGYIKTYEEIVEERARRV